MKLILSLALLLVSGLAKADLENVDSDRQTLILNTLFASEDVKPVKEMAEQRLGLKSTDAKFGVRLDIDCAKRPMSYGRDLAAGYCLVNVSLAYGWYADPSMVLEVTAYIKKEKIKAGDIVLRTSERGAKRWELQDLAITSVNVRTPLPTGLE